MYFGVILRPFNVWPPLHIFKLEIMLFLALKRFRNYELYTGPARNVTSLGTVDAASTIHCARKCTFAEGCEAVKMTGTGDNGRVVCQLYKESDGANVVQETNIYLKI